MGTSKGPSVSGACFRTAAHSMLTGLSDIHDKTSNIDGDNDSDDNIDGGTNDGSMHRDSDSGNNEPIQGCFDT